MSIRPVHLLRLGVPAALVAATLVTITGSSGSAAQPQPGPYAVKPTFGRPEKPAFAPNTVLVKFKKTASASAKAKALGKVNSRSSSAIGGGVTAVVGTPAAPEMLKTLKADASVEKASLDYVRSASAVPNDTYYGSNQAGSLGAIRMPQAWDLTKTAGTQTVAVLDTGIDAGHPDLAGRVLAGHNEINPAASPNDDAGHGTMTAGIIGANTNNGVGVAGVAWNVKILPVKVLDQDGNGYDSDIIDGVTWAANNGARVINMSLGGDGDNSLLHDAITAAVNKGVVVVAAAGNSGSASPSYPASYPEVLSVAATDNNGALTSFSTQGDWVDIAAPGWKIISTGPRSLTPAGYLPYWTNSGTSFSAPMVAGVAALLRNKYPTYTPAQIMARLKSTARDAGPRGLDPYYGAGILDAYNALGGAWAPEYWTAGPDGNDTPARATAITGTSITGSTGPEGDVDWYKITSATAHSVAVTVTTPVYDWENRAQNFAPVVKVYDKDLQQTGSVEIDTEPETASPLTAGVDVNLVAGDNYISVRNYNGSRDGRVYTVSYADSGSGPDPVASGAWVQNSSVQNYATGVAQNVKPVLTSATDLSPASVVDSTVQLLNGTTGAVVPSTVEYAADTKQITITPNVGPARQHAIPDLDRRCAGHQRCTDRFVHLVLPDGRPGSCAGHRVRRDRRLHDGCAELDSSGRHHGPRPGRRPRCGRHHPACLTDCRDRRGVGSNDLRFGDRAGQRDQLRLQRVGEGPERQVQRHSCHHSTDRHGELADAGTGGNRRLRHHGHDDRQGHSDRYRRTAGRRRVLALRPQRERHRLARDRPEGHRCQRHRRPPLHAGLLDRLRVGLRRFG